MEEVVRVVPSNDRYLVSNMGWYARRDNKGDAKTIRWGYPGARDELRAPLYKNQIPTMWQMSRLVASAFLPDWDPEYQVEHIDGDRHNNRADNLRMSMIGAH